MKPISNAVKPSCLRNNGEYSSNAMVLPMEIKKLHFKASSGKVIDTIMISVDLPLVDHFCMYRHCFCRMRETKSRESEQRDVDSRECTNGRFVSLSGV